MLQREPRPQRKTAEARWLERATASSRRPRRPGDFVQQRRRVHLWRAGAEMLYKDRAAELFAAGGWEELVTELRASGGVLSSKRLMSG